MPSLSFSCFGARSIPLLTAYRLLLSVLCCADIVLFSATQHHRDTDNPEKTPVAPLLLRCLALLALCSVLFVCHVGLLSGTGGSGGLRPRPVLLRSLLLSFAHSFSVLAAAIYCVPALLNPHSPLSSLLPTAVFSLHAAFMTLPLAPSPTSQLPPTGTVNSDSAPLLCAWLSCYWLALDHDDKLQIWPLAALLALHTSHAVIAVARLGAVSAQHSRGGRDDASKATSV